MRWLCNVKGFALSDDPTENDCPSLIITLQWHFISWVFLKYWATHCVHDCSVLLGRVYFCPGLLVARGASVPPKLFYHCHVTDLRNAYISGSFPSSTCSSSRYSCVDLIHTSFQFFGNFSVTICVSDTRRSKVFFLSPACRFFQTIHLAEQIWEEV